MPLGFLTKDSPRPEFAELYGATEMPTTIDPPPTEQNVRDATAMLWFGSVNKLRETTTLMGAEAIGELRLIVLRRSGIKRFKIDVDLAR